MTGGEKPIIPADRQPAYKKGCTAFVKRLLTKFDDFTIYTPSDYSMEGPLIFSTYKDEADEAPAFYFIIEGLPSFKAWSMWIMSVQTSYYCLTVLNSCNIYKCSIALIWLLRWFDL